MDTLKDLIASFVILHRNMFGDDIEEWPGWNEISIGSSVCMLSSVDCGVVHKSAQLPICSPRWFGSKANHKSIYVDGLFCLKVRAYPIMV